MRRFLLWFFIVLVTPLYADSIPPALATEVYQHALQIKAAGLRNDAVYMVQVMPQPVIDKMGVTRDQLIAQSKKIMQLLTSRQLTMVKYEVSKPTHLYRFNRTKLTFVPIESVIKTPTRLVHSKSFLVAVQYDGNPKWYFLNGKGLSNANVFYKFFSKAPKSIVIPKHQVDVSLHTPASKPPGEKQ